jgi:hypothetical protein
MIRRYLQGLDIITVLTQEILYFTENLCAIFLNGDTAESGQREQVVDSPRNIIGDRKQRAVVQHGIRWLPYFKRFGITPFHKRVVQPGVHVVPGVFRLGCRLRLLPWRLVKTVVEKDRSLEIKVTVFGEILLCENFKESSLEFAPKPFLLFSPNASYTDNRSRVKNSRGVTPLSTILLTMDALQPFIIPNAIRYIASSSV